MTCSLKITEVKLQAVRYTNDLIIVTGGPFLEPLTDLAINPDKVEVMVYQKLREKLQVCTQNGETANSVDDYRRVPTSHSG